jgi:ferredoxin-NADP reductase
VTAAPLPQGEYELDLVVVKKVCIARDVVKLDLRDAGETDLPFWRPGAHVDLVLGSDLVRQYSLTGAPEDQAVWTLAVLRDQEGRGGSVFVHDQLEQGSRVHVQGPRNKFQLVASPRYIFIAGGIGITPIRPMLAAAEKAGSQWSLLYGGRSRDSMAFADELVDAYPGHVTLQPEDEYGLLDLPPLIGSPQPDTKIYCCGPERLLRAVEQLCNSWPSDSLHVERFSAKPVEPSLSGGFRVRLERSELTIDVPPDMSVMEAVREAGVDVPSSCEEGLCGTCETRVLRGTPEHRDSILTPEEQAKNDVMMICVSRGSTDLVLDL